MRVALALSFAVVAALIMADAHIGSVPVWKIALALCGVAIIRLANRP